MFCHKCGAGLQPDANFCGKCGASVATASDPPVSQSHETTPPVTVAKDALKLDSSSDMSWGMMTLNFVGMLIIAYMTHPIPSELRSSSAPIFLLIRIGVPAFFSAIVVAIFYAFRKKKEARLIRRSFVIATWVFLGLTVLGVRS